MWRKILIFLTSCAIIGLFILQRDPILSNLHRVALVGTTLGVWLGTLLLVLKHKIWRWIVLAITILLVTPFALPGRVIQEQ